jgi:hypothetical protein
VNRCSDLLPRQLDDSVIRISPDSSLAVAKQTWNPLRSKTSDSTWSMQFTKPSSSFEVDPSTCSDSRSRSIPLERSHDPHHPQSRRDARRSRDKPLRVTQSLYRCDRPGHPHSLSETVFESTPRQSTCASFFPPSISLITLPRKNRNNPEAGTSIQGTPTSGISLGAEMGIWIQDESFMNSLSRMNCCSIRYGGWPWMPNKG